MSAASDVYKRRRVSKEVFKKAVGDLYKKRLVVLDEKGITLVR